MGSTIFPSELAQRYVDAKKEGKNLKYFPIVYRAFNDAQREEVIRMIRESGVEVKIPECNDEKKSPIIWTDDEWNFIADICWKLRKKNPSLSLLPLARKAVEQLPASRRRFLNYKNLKPLSQIFSERLDKLEKGSVVEKIVHVESKSESKQVKSKEEILGELTENEIFDLFAERIISQLQPEDIIYHFSPQDILNELTLEDISGYLLMNMFREFCSSKQQDVNITVTSQESKPSNGANVVKVAPTTRKKITLFGLIPKQQEIIRRACGNEVKLTFFNKNRTRDIPKDQDAYILWKRFIDHATFNGVQQITKDNRSKMIVHETGLSDLVELVKGMI